MNYSEWSPAQIIHIIGVNKLAIERLHQDLNRAATQHTVEWIANKINQFKTHNDTMTAELDRRVKQLKGRMLIEQLAAEEAVGSKVIQQVAGQRIEKLRKELGEIEIIINIIPQLA